MNHEEDNLKPQSDYEGPHAYDLPPQNSGSAEPGELSFSDRPKDLTFVELCYGILFQPRETFSRMVENPPVFYAFLILTGVIILQNLVEVIVGIPSSLAQMNRMPGGIPREMQAIFSVLSQPGFGILAGVLGLVFGLFWWFINSAILHLLAELFGGKGKGMGVMAVTGASLLPGILLIPVQVLIYALDGPQWVVTLLAVIIAIYTYIILPILGIALVHRFGTGRAIATVLTPWGVFILSIILFIGTMVAMMGMLMPMLQGIR
ncbi:MAG: Yip1 family protein [Clostridia bacterium]|nr:Yip1 family protein [Clostridia bacterium]